MIQLQVCFCLLGLALAALGVAMLLRPQRLRRFLRRLDARLWKWTGRRLAWSRLAGSGLLLRPWGRTGRCWATPRCG